MAEYESNTRSLAVAGTTLGSIGTGLAILNGGLGNLFGGLGGANNNQFVSKETFEMAQVVASKDSEIALLKSEANTENKITEVYRLLKADMNAIEKAQAVVNGEQAVLNNQLTNNVAVISNNVAQLQALTKLVVPATSVCPEPLPRYNSFVVPTTGTTTG